MMCRIAVLISNAGPGTNLQAIIDGTKSGKINGSVVVVISDKIDALGLKRARNNHIPIKINTEKQKLLPLLKKFNPDYICLTGWKQFLTDEVIDAFPNRILNTHPGLIPDKIDGVVKNPDGTDAFWTKKMFTVKAMQNFIDNKATYAGCSNHFITHEIDFGPVLGRCFEKIEKTDTVDSLYTRLKVKENKMYVDVLAKLCSSKTVLIIDGGGRGAALVDKYSRSDKVGRILVVPGNDLMLMNTRKLVFTYQHLKTTSVPEILEICKKEKVDLVDVAQDNAVEAGLVDAVSKSNIPVFGPTRTAGQIEWDKAWARNFMQKYGLPAPKFYAFNSVKEGVDFVKKNPNSRWFVKAAGLAEGKGVIPAENVDQAISAIKEMQKFGTSGKTYLLEEWLVGEEFSAFAISDGKDFQILGFAQDHKRVNDGDKGPNTGGMGCVSNPLVISNINSDLIGVKVQISNIFRKTIDGLAKEKRPYKGVLYLGGMVVDGKIMIIEFNARWGDPEAEVLLPAIKNDYFYLAQEVIKGNLKTIKISVDKKVRVAVAAVAKGYPTDYSKVKGRKVLGIEKAMETGVKIYGAGIKKIGEEYRVNGGRVLYVVGEGRNVIEARKQAYQAMKLINIEGNNLHFRSDIGWRDMERLKK